MVSYKELLAKRAKKYDKWRQERIKYRVEQRATKVRRFGIEPDMKEIVRIELARERRRYRWHQFLQRLMRLFR